jgi:hypothetical protein
MSSITSSDDVISRSSRARRNRSAPAGQHLSNRWPYTWKVTGRTMLGTRGAGGNMRHIQVFLCLLVLVATACGDNESSAGPPWGLDAIEMPDSEAGVLAVFAAFPDEIDGFSRWTTDVASAHYGGLGPDRVAIDPYALGFIGSASLEQVARLMKQPDTDWTTIEWLTWVASPASPLPPVEASDLDPTRKLVWVATQESGPPAERDTFMAHWARPDGSWVFSLQANTEAGRRRLDEPFVMAAGR